MSTRNPDPGDPIQISVPPRAADKKRKLGKGLGALMGETRREEPLVRQNPATDGGESSTNRPTAALGDNVTTAKAASGLNMLAVSSIKPLPGQPRKHFDEAALDELAASISARGVIQPIIVRPLSVGHYQLVAGERRWRAAQKAQLHEIPALVRDLDDEEVMALALIENIQREDLNPVEEARAYRDLADNQKMSQSAIAKLVDKSRSHVANLQRLLGLPDDVLDLVEGGTLSMGHARALVGHEDASGLALRAIKEKLSVRDVEKLARGDTAGKANKKRTARPISGDADNADIVAVQRHLEEFIGLPVKISADADPRSGAVTIRYNTLDQLDLICQRLTGGDI